METIVKKGATIGANATIICGNIIGKYSFIGAGSVVTKDVNDYELVVGNPAKRIGWISEFGHRLNFNKDNVAKCEESHLEYKLFDNKVIKLKNEKFCLNRSRSYIAPRHMIAIKETGNNLIAALDKFDSVGILDSYFPEADFFVESERFDRHIEKLKNDKNIPLDYVSICTKYLHDSHTNGLEMGS